MLFRASAGFLESIGEVDTLMQLAAGINVMIVTVFVLVELVTIFKDISASFGGRAITIIAVAVGKQLVYLLPSKNTTPINKNMSVKRFAFVTFFVAEAPI